MPDLNVEETLLAILAHPDVCSRRPLIEHYDTVVRGATVIPSGYADAGVFIIKRGGRAGIAISVDGNPRFGAISAKLAAAHAVVESARNVAAVGAQPIGLTDCLNYGNPEDPVAYRQLMDGIDGLAEAAEALALGAPGEPLPFVSGNVSLYNESASGRAVAPSAIVACVGRIEDVRQVVTMQITAPGNPLVLLGRRRAELGGSVLAAIEGVDAGVLVGIDYDEAVRSIRCVIEGIRAGVILAAHDISDGGLLACVAEMCLGGDANGIIGAQLLAPSAWARGLDPVAALFGEAGGFVVEVGAQRPWEFHNICKAHGLQAMLLGTTGGDSLAVEKVCGVPLDRLAVAWSGTLKELFA